MWRTDSLLVQVPCCRPYPQNDSNRGELLHRGTEVSSCTVVAVATPFLCFLRERECVGVRLVVGTLAPLLSYSQKIREIICRCPGETSNNWNPNFRVETSQFQKFGHWRIAVVTPSLVLFCVEGDGCRCVSVYVCEAWHRFFPQKLQREMGR